MLSVVAVQSTKIYIFFWLHKRREWRDGRGCVSVWHSLSGLYLFSNCLLSISLLACVCLADDCRVTDCASVCLATGVIGKAAACSAYLENVICTLSHQLRELFGGVVHGNACTKLLFTHAKMLARVPFQQCCILPYYFALQWHSIITYNNANLLI